MALQNHEGMTQDELTSIVCVDKAATARAVKSLEEDIDRLYSFLLQMEVNMNKISNKRVYHGNGDGE